MLRTCERCGAAISRKSWQKPNEYRRARFCGRACSARSKKIPIRDRLLDSIQLAAGTGCWEWTKYRDPSGYGRSEYEGEVMAHRISFLAFVGSIPGGLHVLHRCDNPCCINPRHLFLGTNADNVKDRVSKGRQQSVAKELNPRAKLTEAEVAEIRAADATQAQLARRYGVCPSTIGYIRRRETWA